MRHRSVPELEHPVHVLGAVDVESDQRIVEHCGFEAEAPRLGDVDGGSVGLAEGGNEHIYCLQRERVRTTVLGRTEGDRTGRRR